MITQLARLANDCYHLWRAPTRSKTAVLRDLVLPTGSKMGFEVEHFDPHTRNDLYREIFVRQYYYFSSTTEAPVVLDCGANVGMATLYFKWLYPKAQVQAFEPDPATFEMLGTNIKRNNLDVEAHNCALWDSDSVIDFNSGSAVPGSLLMSAEAHRLDGEPIRVPARRLSTFISGKVDFLKLDVEGAEHRVLSDLTASGKIGDIQQMVIEYHHRIGEQKSRLGEFLSRLEQAGFEYQLHSPLYPVTARGVFQDMLIRAYRENR